MSDSVATAVDVRSVGEAGSRATTVVVPSGTSSSGTATSSQATTGSPSTVGSQSASVVSRTSDRLRRRARIWPKVPSGEEKSSSGRPLTSTTRTTSPCSRTADTRPRTVVASTTEGEVGSERSTVVIVVSRPSDEEPSTTARPPTSRSSPPGPPGQSVPRASSSAVVDSRVGSSPETS